MTNDRLYLEICEDLGSISLLDAHTHLVDGKLGARGLHDILLYHMAVSDLYGAGCPSGARLTEYPGWPSVTEAHQRIKEALPYLKYVHSTSISWGIRLILEDLYGWKEPLTLENWQRLDDMIRERADDRAWQREIVRRTNIQRYCTEYARRESGKIKISFNMRWSGRSSRDANGESLTQRSMNWSVVGERRRRVPARLGEGSGPLPNARSVDWMTFTLPLTTTLRTYRTTRFCPRPRTSPPTLTYVS